VDNVIDTLPVFYLERWQSLRETSARIQLSESGVEPISIAELEEICRCKIIDNELRLGYGWTKGSPRLREEIIDLYQEAMGADNVLITTGSAEANLLTVLTLVKDGDYVIVDMPNYMQIPGLLRWRNARVIELWRKSSSGFTIPMGELEELVKRYRPRAIFITNPNNPTGAILEEKELEEIACIASSTGSILVFDEVYRGLEHDGITRPSIIDVAGLETAVSVSGLSKVYGLPGLRIGWVVASERLIEKMWSLKDYTSISPAIMSDYIASIALRRDVREKLVRRSRRIVLRDKELMLEILGDKDDLLKIHVPRAGAYFYAYVPWSTDTLNLCERLYEKHSILVNPGECFDMPGYIRVGMGQEPSKYAENIMMFLKALEELKKASAS